MKTIPEFPAQSDSKFKKKGNTTIKSFSIINPNAAGIDIGADSHWVSVPQSRDAQPVRRFGCLTSDLYALANWLKECQVETVAMESTGVISGSSDGRIKIWGTYAQDTADRIG